MVDGDTAKLQLNLGFGVWKLCTIYPGADKEARYPQGVYRLYGINTPEVHGAEKGEGLRSLARLNELISQSATGDSVVVATHKDKEHGKYRYMVEILIPVEPQPLGFDVEEEKKSWLSPESCSDLLKETEEGDGGALTVRALVTEVLARRRAMGEGRMINANQVLLEEGLAKPYFGGKK